MLIYEYKVDGTERQYAAIDEAIRIVQFIRNKCLRLWMDEGGISKNDLQVYCAVLAKEYPFANHLNSRHVKRRLIGPGSLSPISMTTAKPTSQARRAIRSFSMMLEASNTR